MDDTLQRVVPSNTLVQVSAWDVVDQPGLPVLDAWNAHQIAAGKPPGIASFWALQRHPLLLTLRPSDRPHSVAPATDRHVCDETPSGRKKVSALEYRLAIQQVRPHIAVAMYDTCERGAPPKRSKQAADRTVQWLHEVLGKPTKRTAKPPPVTPAGGVAMADAATSADVQRPQPSVALPGVFAALPQLLGDPIPPIFLDPDLAGYAICHLHCGLTDEEQRAYVRTAMGALPSGKPRLLCGQDGPLQVLELISLGIDLFSGEYPVSQASRGFALCFAFSPSMPVPPQPKLNVRDPRHAIDSAPLVDGCACETCALHSRGYLHHLWNTREMTVDVLLRIHNLHHYLGFFASLRGSLEQGTFPQWSTFLRAQFSTAAPEGPTPS
eukprot:GGOE01014711.1.p1 GENE.GGOE01014711.1~~GGOE01014711.1.p1  ORF type:complete len:442 (+),score=92.06 GGOE01014711.1:184-1326(+)